MFDLNCFLRTLANLELLSDDWALQMCAEAVLTVLGSCELALNEPELPAEACLRIWDFTERTYNALASVRPALAVQLRSAAAAYAR